MKRAIINQLGQLSEQLKAYVGALNYRYLNLCVKAEEVVTTIHFILCRRSRMTCATFNRRS